MIRFVVINGFLYGLTANGRFRKNWRTAIRHKDYKEMVSIFSGNQGVCSRCKKLKKLTVHHNPPLYICIDGRKEYLCERCHFVKEQDCEIKYKLKERPLVMHCPDCKWYNYLDETMNTIYCKNCGKTMRLKKIGEDEYTLPKYFVEGEKVIKQL